MVKEVRWTEEPSFLTDRYRNSQEKGPPFQLLKHGM
jgi:hypothetical protein